LTNKVVSPKVSIGMPVYNGESYICEALDSLLKQSFTDYELIISDNASTDNTEIICRAYAAKDSRIKYIRQIKNRGAFENFGLLVSEAIAEYFMWFAADDKAETDFIKTLFDIINKDEEIVLVMSDVQNIAGDGSLLDITQIENIRMAAVIADWPKVRRLFFENPTTNIFFCIYGIHRTKTIRTIQLNYKGRVKYAAASEVPLLAQVSLMGKIVAIPRALKIYRRHEESIYTLEVKNTTVIQDIHKKINVTLILIDILTNSKIAFLEKILIFKVIMYTVLRFIAGTVARVIIRWVKKR
jgi:glycosyltransferase involved in cell wall biosynthesis